jgi:hypothetical protein
MTSATRSSTEESLPGLEGLILGHASVLCAWPSVRLHSSGILGQECSGLCRINTFAVDYSSLLGLSVWEDVLFTSWANFVSTFHLEVETIGMVEVFAEKLADGLGVMKQVNTYRGAIAASMVACKGQWEARLSTQRRGISEVFSIYR